MQYAKIAFMYIEIRREMDNELAQLYISMLSLHMPTEN